jgi:hypothetical protein
MGLLRLRVTVGCILRRAYHERLLFFVGIIAAPIVAELLEPLPRYRPEIDKQWLNVSIIFGIAAFVVLRFPGPAQLQKQVNRQYPAEIVPYLKSHKPTKRVLNYYEWAVTWAGRLLGSKCSSIAG